MTRLVFSFTVIFVLDKEFCHWGTSLIPLCEFLLKRQWKLLTTFSCHSVQLYHQTLLLCRLSLHPPTLRYHCENLGPPVMKTISLIFITMLTRASIAFNLRFKTCSFVRGSVSWFDWRLLTAEAWNFPGLLGKLYLVYPLIADCPIDSYFLTYSFYMFSM